MKIPCLVCGDEGEKKVLLRDDIFISYTCPKCKKNIFDILRRNEDDSNNSN